MSVIENYVNSRIVHLEQRSKIDHMKAFHSGREAKEFLISEIVAEAQRENVPLSEVEHKMLYFTESGWTLPGIMTVSEDFDREYDQTEYENKIARLIKRAYKRVCKGSREEYDAWWAAIRRLGKEDHYISVMVRLAGLRPRGDQWKLLGAGLAISTCLLMAIFLSINYNMDASKYLPSRDAFWFYVWTAGVRFVVASYLLGFIIREGRADDPITRILAKVFRLR